MTASWAEAEWLRSLSEFAMQNHPLHHSSFPLTESHCPSSRPCRQPKALRNPHLAVGSSTPRFELSIWLFLNVVDPLLDVLKGCLSDSLNVLEELCNSRRVQRPTSHHVASFSDCAQIKKHIPYESARESQVSWVCFLGVSKNLGFLLDEFHEKAKGNNSFTGGPQPYSSKHPIYTSAFALCSTFRFQSIFCKP